MRASLLLKKASPLYDGDAYNTKFDDIIEIFKTALKFPTAKARDFTTHLIKKIYNRKIKIMYILLEKITQSDTASSLLDV